MAYIILGADYKRIYGYATTEESAIEVMKKLSYLQDEDIFIQEIENLDNFELPEKLYVTVSESSGNTTPKIRKFNDAVDKKLQKSFKNACEVEEYRKTRLFMYQHFVVKTRKRETKKHLKERILTKYQELFEKNLKTHLKPIIRS